MKVDAVAACCAIIDVAVSPCAIHIYSKRFFFRVLEEARRGLSAHIFVLPGLSQTKKCSKLKASRKSLSLGRGRGVYPGRGGGGSCIRVYFLNDG